MFYYFVVKLKKTLKGEIQIMFRKNTAQQLNLDDPTITLPKYLRRNLEKSWAASFNTYIFSIYFLASFLNTTTLNSSYGSNSSTK